jgi:hypothetical protein
MIADRASSYRDYSDLFSNLLAANENDSEGLKLTDEELTGNIFIFLIGEPLLRPLGVLVAQGVFVSRPRNYCSYPGIYDRIVGAIS